MLESGVNHPKSDQEVSDLFDGVLTLDDGSDVRTTRACRGKRVGRVVAMWSLQLAASGGRRELFKFVENSEKDVETAENDQWFD